ARPGFADIVGEEPITEEAFPGALRRAYLRRGRQKDAPYRLAPVASGGHEGRRFSPRDATGSASRSSYRLRFDPVAVHGPSLAHCNQFMVFRAIGRGVACLLMLVMV